MSTTPEQGVPPSSNATHGESEVDAFAVKVAANLGIEAAPAAEPVEDAELTETQGVSASKDAEADPTDTTEGEATDAPADSDAEESDGEDGEEAPPPLTSLTELADALEIEVDDLMALKLPTKVDGEDGEATLRDLLKSHQTEQHLTRKGQKLAEEKREFDTKRQQAESELQQRLQSLDTALQLANQRLMGKFSKIDWESLRANNPQAYQQAYIEYQQLYGELSAAAQALQQEQARYASIQEEQFAEYVKEQRRLWSTIKPEWSDAKIKARDLEDMKSYVKGYEIDPADLDRMVDHRYGRILMDALAYHRLQQKAEGVKKKVKDAGPIVRPGLRKSAAAVDRQKVESLKQRLKKSGDVKDLAQFIRGTL